jgi:hypothetical protein
MICLQAKPHKPVRMLSDQIMRLQIEMRDQILERKERQSERVVAD